MELPDGEIVPDLEESGQMMEQEYKDLMQQEYVLVKHGGLTREAVSRMTQEDRNLWITFMNQEREKEEKAAKKAQGSKTPHFPSN